MASLPLFNCSSCYDDSYLHPRASLFYSAKELRSPLSPRKSQSLRTNSFAFGISYLSGRRILCRSALKGASTVELELSFTVKKVAVEVAPKLKGTSIFLVGMTGNMKTTAGKILSDALRYYYFDSDDLIEQAGGRESAARDLREKDEEGYCNSETEVLKQLSSMGRLVVCAGDGAVQGSTNLAFLRYGISLWIDIPLDLLAKEAIANINKCPQSWGISSSNSFSEVLVKLTKVYEQMREGYATADATVSLQKVASRLDYVDMGAVTADDMTIEALKEIEKLTRVKKMMEDAARPF